mmetsp:Transcript_13702/g.41388  ORF Transcript_13702/g.41388 Transcript_13702/m.41388 type:complete len:350 (-) Transcript_13702:1017-2066(-)
MFGTLGAHELSGVPNRPYSSQHPGGTVPHHPGVGPADCRGLDGLQRLRERPPLEVHLSRNHAHTVPLALVHPPLGEEIEGAIAQMESVVQPAHPHQSACRGDEQLDLLAVAEHACQHTAALITLSICVEVRHRRKGFSLCISFFYVRFPPVLGSCDRLLEHGLFLGRVPWLGGQPALRQHCFPPVPPPQGLTYGGRQLPGLKVRRLIVIHRRLHRRHHRVQKRLILPQLQQKLCPPQRQRERFPSAACASCSSSPAACASRSLSPAAAAAAAGSRHVHPIGMKQQGGSLPRVPHLAQQVCQCKCRLCVRRGPRLQSLQDVLVQLDCLINLTSCTVAGRQSSPYRSIIQG